MRQSLNTVAILATTVGLLGCPAGTKDFVTFANTEIVFDEIRLEQSTLDISVGESRSVQCVGFKSGVAQTNNRLVGATFATDRADVVSAGWGTAAQGDGRVTVLGLKPGPANVTCSFVQGTTNKVTLTANMLVNVRPYVITVTPGIRQVEAGQSAVFTATVTTFDGRPTPWYNPAALRWTIVPSTLATVTGGGTGATGTFATSPGTNGVGTVRATDTGPGEPSGTATLDVSELPASGVVFCSGVGLTLTGSNLCGLFSTDGTRITSGVTWTVGASSPATVDAGGIVRATASAVAGSSATVTGSATVNGQSVSGSATLPIGTAGTATSVTVSFAGGAPSAVRVGNRFRLACAASGAGGPLTIFGPVYSVQMTGAGAMPFSIDQFGWLTASATGTATAQCFVNGVRGAMDITVAP